MTQERTQRAVNHSTFSEHLSRVLEDIGINKDIIETKRKVFQSIENMFDIHACPTIVRFYGSQTEGTTTIDLKSDLDMLYVKMEWNVMQSDTDTEKGNWNLRLVKDDSTAPGYCRLHLLKETDIPLLMMFPGSMHYTREGENICVLNNVMFGYFQTKSNLINNKYPRRGPSKQITGRQRTDDVGALSLSSWPSEGKAWLTNFRRAKWPTEEMRKVIATHKCLLVPVGCSRSDRPLAEWRISYSETERYLMFNMNVVQLQCYVLLKLIRNRFLTKNIRSYYLKTVLLYTIERTDEKKWTPQLLFVSVLRCLKTLGLWLKTGYCPQFFNSQVNLFYGKLSLGQREKLESRITSLIDIGYQLVYRIQADDLGLRMLNSLSEITSNRVFITADEISSHIQLCLSHAHINYKSFFVNNTFQEYKEIVLLIKLVVFLRNGTLEQKAGAMALLPDILANFASVIISFCMMKGVPVHRGIQKYLAFGTLERHITMSLKLATIYFMRGQFKTSLKLIHQVESLESVRNGKLLASCWLNFAVWNEGLLPRGTQFAECVRFLRQEICICPFELTFEMFRSTAFEREFRLGPPHNWLDTAELDPLPYLYYIKFLLCKALKLDQQADEAIVALIYVVDHLNLSHRETVCNILGQYYEGVNATNDALLYYSTSLLYRPFHNAAKWLLGIMVYQHFCKVSRKSRVVAMV